MVELANKHPQVHAEFLKDNFVVQKSARKFSLVAKDQAFSVMCHSFALWLPQGMHRKVQMQSRAGVRCTALCKCEG